MSQPTSNARLRFGNCVLDTARSIVVAPDGSETALRPKTLEVLRLLLGRAGQLVSRDEIMGAVWPGVFVTDDSITQAVVEIRKAMGADESRALRTVNRRGYLLDAEPADAAGPLQPAGRADRAAVPTLALLPFRLRPPDPALALFAEALHEDIVGSIATLREPAVISANSTRHLVDMAEADTQAVARRLGADYVASGTVRRAGGGVRVAVEVADGRAGTALWARGFDLPDAALFQATDELAAAIANAVAPRVKESELRRLRSARAHALGAYQLLLEARSVMFRMERAGFGEAEALLRRAAAEDPGFAAPWTALGNFYALRVGQAWSDDPAADARLCEDALLRALELDPEAARALGLLGHTQSLLHRRYDRAFDLLDRAVAIAPNDAETCMWSSLTHAFTGRAEEGVRRAERAIRLSPEDPLLFRYEHYLSLCHYMAGDHGAAADWGLRSDRRNPFYISNLRATAAALVALGRLDEARRLGRRMVELLPAFRVRDYVPRVPFQDPAAREEYGRRLEAAGVPH